jgi:hypothetical protein
MLLYAPLVYAHIKAGTLVDTLVDGALMDPVCASHSHFFFALVDMPVDLYTPL